MWHLSKRHAHFYPFHTGLQSPVSIPSALSKTEFEYKQYPTAHKQRAVFPASGERRTLAHPRDAVDPDTARQAWDPGPWHDYANEDAEVFNCPALISLLRYHWTSDGWEDPLKAPDLDPLHGYAGEDCAEAFDDEGFSARSFDQA